MSTHKNSIKILRESPASVHETLDRISRFLEKQNSLEELKSRQADISDSTNNSLGARDNVDKAIIHQLQLMHESLQNLGELEQGFI